MPAVDTRDILAPYVGRRLRCRGTLGKDERCNRKHRTLVYDLKVRVGNNWFYAGDHCWVFGTALCVAYGEHAVLEFDARVQQYTTAGRVRYAVGHARDAIVLASADGPSLAGAVAELVERFGWSAVADAVEKAHTE